MAATGNTAIQLQVPDHLRGRVMSVYTTVFAGSTPIGGLVAGAIASLYGVPVAIAFGGAGSLVVGLAAYGWYRSHREAAKARRAPRSVEPAPPLIEPGLADTAAEGAPTATHRSSAPG
jgi:MFS family permease